MCVCRQSIICLRNVMRFGLAPKYEIKCTALRQPPTPPRKFETSDKQFATHFCFVFDQISLHFSDQYVCDIIKNNCI